VRLIGTPTSPYTRKARLVLLEKGLPHQFVVDPPRAPGGSVPTLNPLGRVPVLVLDDGTCIFDSPVIAEYADGLNDAPILIPRTDPVARMRVKRWEALADGILDSAVVVRTERLRPPETQDPDAVRRHDAAIGRALDYAAADLGVRAWCEGEGVTLADLALVSALLYLDLRQPERDWRAAHPSLAGWLARMAQRSSVRATTVDAP
jgi:glutathione S-transferase